jgi:hypothetical protein
MLLLLKKNQYGFEGWITFSLEISCLELVCNQFYLPPQLAACDQNQVFIVHMHALHGRRLSDHVYSRGKARKTGCLGFVYLSVALAGYSFSANRKAMAGNKPKAQSDSRASLFSYLSVDLRACLSISPCPATIFSDDSPVPLRKSR